MRRLGAALAWLCTLPACNQLLGISNPVAGDATATDDTRPDDAMSEDAALDAPPACTTATSFGNDISSAVGGTGVAMAIGRFDNGAVNDVAVAVTSDTVILLGNNAGAFTVSQTLTEPAIALAVDDFDNIRDGVVAVTATSATMRRQTAAGVFGAAQPLDGPFTGADAAIGGELGATLVPDVVIGTGAGAIAFTSNLGTLGTFTKGDTVGAAGDAVVFVGQIDKDNDEDLIFVDGSGNVKLALSDGTDGSFGPLAQIATGATGRGVGVGNFDDDNFLDLVVATAAGGEIYLQNSASPGVFTKQTGTFGGIQSTAPLLVGDLNGDTLDDVVTPTTVVLQCPTTRVFTQVESIDAARGLLGDVNGDSKLDLLRLSGTDLIVRLQQ